VEAQIIEHSPMDKIRSPKADFEPRPAITTEVVTKLLHVCTSLRDRALLLFFLETGCRAGEVVRLICADIDLAQKTALVRKSKARKARLVYFGAHTQRALVQYFAQRGAPRADEAVWLSEQGTPLAYEGMRQLLRRLGQRAGVARFGPHALRRTFAVQAHCNGMGDRTLMMLLGHSTPEMLRHYLPLGDDQLKHAYKEFGPFRDLDLDLPDLGQSQD
jgi:integrase/recombinase XerD